MIDQTQQPAVHLALSAARTGLQAVIGDVERLANALRQIAASGEQLQRDAGEPQNYVPAFCRAVLAGYTGTLQAFALDPVAACMRETRGRLGKDHDL